MTGGTQLGFGKAPLSWGGSVRREEAKRRATLSVVAKWERSEKARSTDPRPDARTGARGVARLLRHRLMLTSASFPNGVMPTPTT